MSAPSAAVQLDGDQLALLEIELKQQLPRSFKVYGQLTAHRQGQWPGMTFWVDTWPDFTAVVCRSCVGQSEEAQRRSSCSYSMFIRKTDKLSKLLEETVDWNATVVLEATEERAWPVAETLGAEKALRLTSPGNVLLYTATRNTLVEWSVPKGFTLSRLTPEQADMVIGTWKYAMEGMQEYGRTLISTFPSVCLRDDRGRVVGHELVYQHISPGMLHVHPEFRGQGLGKVIVSQLARQMLEESDTVFVTVEEGNAIAKHVHEVCGFRRVPDFLCRWLVFTTE